MPKSRPGLGFSRSRPVPDFEIIGHRGDGSGTGENSLASYRTAIAKGADRLEVDVQLIRNRLVLAHPPRKSLTSLDELLRAVKLPIVLHVKRRHFNPRHDRRVVDRIARLRRSDVTVSTFWPGTATYTKRRYPEIRTAFLSMWADYDLLLSRRLGVAEYHVWDRSIGHGTATRARRRDVKLIACPMSRIEAPKSRVLNRGAEGVITNQVSQWSRVLAASRSRAASAGGTARAARRRA